MLMKRCSDTASGLLVEVAGLPVALGADKLVKNVGGDTPPHRAAYSGHAEVVEAPAAPGVDEQASHRRWS
jgi:ankyrin repeat protein